MDNTLPEGIAIKKLPCCNGCRTFIPTSEGGETVTQFDGQRIVAQRFVRCEFFYQCNRAYNRGKKEAEQALKGGANNA